MLVDIEDGVVDLQVQIVVVDQVQDFFVEVMVVVYDGVGLFVKVVKKVVKFKVDGVDLVVLKVFLILVMDMVGKLLKVEGDVVQVFFVVGFVVDIVFDFFVLYGKVRDF